MSESKDNKNAGCVVIAILLCLSWGIPSLISGNGFLNGIKENIFAAITLSVIGLCAFVVYKIFLEK